MTLPARVIIIYLRFRRTSAQSYDEKREEEKNGVRIYAPPYSNRI